MSAPFAVYGAARGGSSHHVKLELNRELAETEGFEPSIRL